MLIKLLTKVFGSRNDRTLRRMRKAVTLINSMEPEMENTKVITIAMVTSMNL